MSHTQDKFAYALSSNQAWAGYKAHQNPNFFPTLASGQAPAILWIGCSDSRVPETTILGLQPGDVFVHRNIANVVSPTDINTSAVIEFAVGVLKVKHVVLCGHSSCGGAVAVLGGGRVGGVLDAWLTPMRAARAAHAAQLGAIADDGARAVRMAELNVEAGVAVLMANATIADAVRDRGLQVHGCLFDIPSGRVRDLGLGTAAASGSGSGSSRSAGQSPGAAAVAGQVVRGRHGMLAFSGANAATISVVGGVASGAGATSGDVVRGRHGVLVFRGGSASMSIS